MRTDVCILGGGIAGLAAAYRLGQDRIPHILLEKAPECGGILTSVSLGPVKVDRFYHHIFTHDRHTLSLLGALGLSDKITWHSTRVGMFLGEKLFEISNPLKFLLAGPFRFSQRLALIRALKKISRIPDPSLFDNQTAEQFLERFCGPAMTREIFLPLLRAKFGSAMENASAAFLIGRIAARAKTRRPFARTERLGYIQGGYQTLLDALQAAIVSRGGILQTNARITSVERIGGMFKILWERAGQVNEVWANTVVNTLPIPLFLRVAKNPPPRYALDLEGIRYQGVIALAMAADRSIAPYYWTAVVKSDHPFSTLVEHTRFQSPHQYGGQHILYMSRYASKADMYWKMTDQEILHRFIEGLAEIFPASRKVVVKAWKVCREEFASPVFERGFLHKVPQQRTPWEGLFNAGSVHVYPDSRNINNVIASGLAAARLAIEKGSKGVRPLLEVGQFDPLLL